MTTLTLSDPTLPASVSIEADRFDSAPPYRHGRWQYRWTVTVGDVSAAGDDLCSGTMPADCAPNLPDALATLLGFLSAAVESYEYAQRKGVDLADTECGQLFPAELLAAASMVGDVWSMLAEYVRPTE